MAWEHELTDLTNQRNSLTQRRNNLSEQIENFNHIISENTEKAAFHAEEVEKFQFLHQQQSDWCAEEQSMYINETEQRRAEKEIMTQLKDYLQSRSSTTEEFIMMKQTTD
jgi:hypothetical protein